MKKGGRPFSPAWIGTRNWNVRPFGDPAAGGGGTTTRVLPWLPFWGLGGGGGSLAAEAFSTARASPSTVGDSKRRAAEISAPSSVRSRESNSIASSECPPRRKKSA